MYFAVAKKGDKPTDGKTDVNPEGLTAGGWVAVGGWWAAQGVREQEVSAADRPSLRCPRLR